MFAFSAVCGQFSATSSAHLYEFGRRAFSVAAPTLRNALPNKLRQSSSLPIFNKHLKSLLFSTAFTWQKMNWCCWCRNIYTHVYCWLTCRTKWSERRWHEAEKQLHTERHRTHCRYYTLSRQSHCYAGEVCAASDQHGHLLHDKGTAYVSK